MGRRGVRDRRPDSIHSQGSRAVLGYHISLNREYSRYDVIRTIEAALA